jgi:hypothetical protein
MFHCIHARGMFGQSWDLEILMIDSDFRNGYVQAKI